MNSEKRRELFMKVKFKCRKCGTENELEIENEPSIMLENLHAIRIEKPDNRKSYYKKCLKCKEGNTIKI